MSDTYITKCNYYDAMAMPKI